MKNIYNERYDTEKYYWGKQPSGMCYRLLALFPPDRPLKLLDVGCGEGRNAIFFARNGYEVTAFDLSPKGVKKTRKLADDIGVKVTVFEANILEYRLNHKFDIIFSTGSLHYIPVELRSEVIQNYKELTNPDGLHVFSIIIEKPFIPKAPDAEETAHKWISGEIFTHYSDWKIKYCEEAIFDCMSGGIPHQHAVNRIIAKKVTAQQVHEDGRALS
jgi:tellurite methyltransferase